MIEEPEYKIFKSFYMGIAYYTIYVKKEKTSFLGKKKITYTRHPDSLIYNSVERTIETLERIKIAKKDHYLTEEELMMEQL